MPTFVLLTRHRFSGRAYTGASHQVCGPFASHNQAKAWSEKIRKKADRVSVRVSQIMSQVKLRPAVLDLLEPRSAPQAVLVGLQSDQHIDCSSSSTWLDIGTLVLASVTRWNGRRYMESRYALIGPFTSEVKAQQWGEQFKQTQLSPPQVTRPLTRYYKPIRAEEVRAPKTPAKLVEELFFGKA